MFYLGTREIFVLGRFLFGEILHWGDLVLGRFWFGEILDWGDFSFGEILDGEILNLTRGETSCGNLYRGNAMKETSWGNLHGENVMGEFARGKLPWGKKCMGKKFDGGNCDTRLRMPGAL